LSSSRTTSQCGSDRKAALARKGGATGKTSPFRSPRPSEGIPPRVGPPSARVIASARLDVLMRREARLDIEAPESRGHRVEAAVQALAVAAIAEKRCAATKIFISDLPPRFPSPLRRRGDGDEETEGPGRRSQTLDDTWWTPRRHPTVRFGLCVLDGSAEARTTKVHSAWIFMSRI
jgi:hypothetical protein